MEEKNELIFEEASRNFVVVTCINGSSIRTIRNDFTFSEIDKTNNEVKLQGKLDDDEIEKTKNEIQQICDLHDRCSKLAEEWHAEKERRKTRKKTFTLPLFKCCM